MLLSLLGFVCARSQEDVAWLAFQRYCKKLFENARTLALSSRPQKIVFALICRNYTIAAKAGAHCSRLSASIIVTNSTKHFQGGQKELPRA